MARSRFTILLALFLTSCVLPSEPRSAVRIEREWGFAGGANEDEALKLADIVKRVLPHFQALEGFVQRPLRIHFADDLGHDKLTGITVWPALGSPWSAVKRGNEQLENTVAHELAHFYFRGIKSKFPSVMREGIADLLANRVFPDPNGRERSLVMVAASYLDSSRSVVMVSKDAVESSLPRVSTNRHRGCVCTTLPDRSIGFAGTPCPHSLVFGGWRRARRPFPP